MALYIPHSIFHLARLLYVRPETFGPPYYVCCLKECSLQTERPSSGVTNSTLQAINVGGIPTWLQAGQPWNLGSIPKRGKKLLSFQKRLQTCFLSHPASSSEDTRGSSFFGVKSPLTRLRMSGDISVIPPYASVAMDSFTVTLSRNLRN